jgi:hypothetical protein
MAVDPVRIPAVARVTGRGGNWQASAGAGRASSSAMRAANSASDRCRRTRRAYRSNSSAVASGWRPMSFTLFCRGSPGLQPREESAPEPLGVKRPEITSCASTRPADGIVSPAAYGTNRGREDRRAREAAACL